MRRIKIIKEIGVLVCVVVWMSVLVNAFAIGSSGGFDLEPGESVEDFIHIMNRGTSAGDIVVGISVEDGGEYIELIEGDEFDILAGGVASAKVRAHVPEDAKVGDSYSATLIFSPISGGVSDGKTVAISYGYTKTFQINVVGVSGRIVEEESGEVGGKLEEEDVGAGEAEGVREAPEEGELDEPGILSKIIDAVVGWFENLF